MNPELSTEILKLFKVDQLLVKTSLALKFIGNINTYYSKKCKKNIRSHKQLTNLFIGRNKCHKISIKGGEILFDLSMLYKFFLLK